jgi:hypothetical protein
MNELRNHRAARMTERDFQEVVIGLAKLHRWHVAHFRPAMTEHGWRTAMEGDTGYPDLTLARNGVVLIVELKTQKGKVTQQQQKWAEQIGEQYRLWRPSDLESIKEELR